jgi:hypothetical protein
MTIPPTYQLHDLGPQAQMLARNCNNERLAMVMQYVAVGSMIVMTAVALSQAWKDAFKKRDDSHGRSR